MLCLGECLLMNPRINRNGWTSLKGVQLLAGGWSKITKDYKITGIPRFMVFDKKGNIVSVDVPRPSSPELKKMLENEESRLKQIT